MARGARNWEKMIFGRSADRSADFFFIIFFRKIVANNPIKSVLVKLADFGYFVSSTGGSPNLETRAAFLIICPLYLVNPSELQFCWMLFFVLERKWFIRFWIQHFVKLSFCQVMKITWHWPFIMTRIWNWSSFHNFDILSQNEAQFYSVRVAIRTCTFKLCAFLEICNPF